MSDPTTPAEQERARAIAGECVLAGPNLGRGMRRCPEWHPLLLEKWCFACRFSLEIRKALVEQGQRAAPSVLESAADALECATQAEMLGGVAKWLRLRAAAIRTGAGG